MKYVIITLLVAVASALPPKLYLAEWNDFKLTHGKSYQNGEEEMLRYEVFHNNMEKIQEHNKLYAAGLETYELGVSHFADMTEKEFQEYLSLSGPNPMLGEHMEEYQSPESVEVPDSLDYRQKNAVNPVKNQGACGSCWAFSTTAALESIYFLKKGKLYSLSEQNLVDCSKPNGNMGCFGGFMENGYNYIRDNGIETEEDYPYTARDGQCQFDKSKSVISITGYTKIPAKDEQALIESIANVGPVNVAVDATKWQLYKNGIFSTTGSYRLNHGVTGIGYGSEGGVKYYIVRNSWGAAWGEEGYIRVAIGSNQVGIADLSGYPTL